MMTILDFFKQIARFNHLRMKSVLSRFSQRLHALNAHESVYLESTIFNSFKINLNFLKQQFFTT